MRIGVIGTGSMGRNHLRVVSNLAQFELTCAMDIDSKQVHEAGQSYFLREFSDCREMLPLVDAVMVSSPTETHYEITRFFLEHDKHVLVEKPITQTITQADELIRIARDRKRVLAVGHLERFNPALRAVFPLISHARFVECQRLGAFSLRSLDVDVVHDLMIHDLDILLQIDPSGIREIRAVGVPVISSQTDIANVRLLFQSGMVANVTASRVSQEKHRKLRIFQDSTYISVDYKDRKAKVLRLQGKQVQEIKPDISPEEPLAVLWTNFFRTVSGESACSVTGEDGLAALQLAVAITKAIDESGTT